MHLNPPDCDAMLLTITAVVTVKMGSVHPLVPHHRAYCGLILSMCVQESGPIWTISGFYFAIRNITQMLIFPQFVENLCILIRFDPSGNDQKLNNPHQFVTKPIAEHVSWRPLARSNWFVFIGVRKEAPRKFVLHVVWQFILPSRPGGLIARGVLAEESLCSKYSLPPTPPPQDWDTRRGEFPVMKGRLENACMANVVDGRPRKHVYWDKGAAYTVTITCML